LFSDQKKVVATDFDQILVLDKCHLPVPAFVYNTKKKIKLHRKITLERAHHRFSPTSVKYCPAMDAFGGKDRKFIYLWDFQTGSQILKQEHVDTLVDFAADNSGRLILFHKHHLEIQTIRNFETGITRKYSIEARWGNSVNFDGRNPVIFAKILKNKKYLLATESKIYFHELESGDLLDTVYLTDSCLNRFSWIEEIAPGMIAFWGIRTSLSVYDCDSKFFVQFNLPKDVRFFKWDVLGPRKILVSNANSDEIFFLSLDPFLWPKMYRYLFLGRVDSGSVLYRIPAEIIYQILNVSIHQ
jgi:hypothetical protein